MLWDYVTRGGGVEGDVMKMDSLLESQRGGGCGVQIIVPGGKRKRDEYVRRDG